IDDKIINFQDQISLSGQFFERNKINSNNIMGHCLSKFAPCIFNKKSTTAQDEENTNDQSAFFKFIEGRRFHNIDGVNYPLPNDDEECIDITPHQPLTIKPRNVSFIQANTFDELPFEDNVFDFIYQRLLFAGYPESKWPYVVNEMVRVLKPGGYLELTELDPSVKRTGPAGTRLFAGLCTLLDKGGDSNACYKLRKYVTEQGYLENINEEEKNVYYGKENGRLGEVSVENSMRVMRDLKTPMMNILQVSSEEYDEICETTTEEIKELNSYYPMIRVYA
ncbi:15588_t:CDS:2, partial [Racocetra persica]